eukprot:TRINITY_DN61990_c0_g2_i1.p1 TRINITY_DN61990_c0_g2~~TRINITY_DN61990_c0_g2_i1.p1  ORF type:complete len:133 (+),score=26.84 TRINITY_DN61990_c0_g2_i1:79-477(+)
MLRSLVGSEMCIRDRYIGTALTVATLAARGALNLMGLQSRWLDCGGHGIVHVYDSGDPTNPTGPPLILQHGACTTGYSMALLAGLLTQGRRVIVPDPVSYTHLRAHETPEHLVCRLLLEKKNTKILTNNIKC